MSTWYDDYLRSDRWQMTRLRRLMQAEHNDEFGCIKCEGCKLWIPLSCIQVHHENYERVGRERMEDLKVLCDGCHNIAHGLRPPLWHSDALKHGNLMVTAATIRSCRALQPVGNIVVECLRFIEASNNETPQTT